MSLTQSIPTVAPVAGPGTTRAFASPSVLPLPLAADHDRLARQRRRWVPASLAALSCDGVEAALLASVAWLASLVLHGLIHCAFAFHGGGPDLQKPPIRSDVGEIHNRPVLTQAAAS